MTTRAATLSVCLALCGLCGCELTDYQPHHETPLAVSDLQKGDAPGAFGGTNARFASGLPGTPSATAPAGSPQSKAAHGSPPQPVADAAVAAAPAFSLSNLGGFPQTNSYSGSDTGGSASGVATETPVAGTTQTGAAAGH